jgi:hypothetical protein
MDWSEYWYYDETSPSCLRWKVDRYKGRGLTILFIRKGDVAGSLDKSTGYWKVNLKGVGIKVHQVVWFLHHGKMQDGMMVDHIDGVSANNHINNMRCVTKALNTRNMGMSSINTSGFCGVSYTKLTNSHGSKTVNEYWKAEWMGADGIKIGKTFSITKLGNDEAFRLACEHRAKMIAELNEQGAGYTTRHGT